MSWITRMLGLDSRSNVENPMVPLSAYVPPWVDVGPATAAGVRVGAETAMRSTVVFAAVRARSETLAALPLHVYEDRDGAKLPTRDDPVALLLRKRPNRHMTSFIWRQTMVAMMDLYGNAYSWIIRVDGEIRQLLVLLPTQVQVQYSAGEKNYLVTSADGQIIVPDADMLHFPGLTLDGRSGISSVLASARQAVGLSLAAEEHAARLFSNGARPSGVLKHPGKLSKEAADRLKASWAAAQGGLANAYRTALLEEGMDFSPLTMSAQDAQMSELRRMQVEEIARVFRLPPVFVGDHTHSTFSNNEQQDLHFSKHCIFPLCRLIEDEINAKLFGDVPRFAEFNLDGLERGDFRGRIEGLVRAVQGGLMTPNEARRKLNLPDDPNAAADELYLQQNMAGLAAVNALAADGGTTNEP
jgi:HK97 family phage portal protein